MTEANEEEAQQQQAQQQQLHDAQQQQEQQQEHQAAERQQRRKKRWGQETEAGRQVLAQVTSTASNQPPNLDPTNAAHAPPASEHQAAAAEGEGAMTSPTGEPAPKKKRSRWAPEEPALTTIPGLPLGIVLPPTIAALVDINPETMELQRQLNAVRTGMHACVCKKAICSCKPLWQTCAWARLGLDTCARHGPSHASMQIQAKLQQITSGQWVDDTPVERRSPSPEPVYGENGLRTNTREQRAKDKLQRERTVGMQGTCHEWFWCAGSIATCQVAARVAQLTLTACSSGSFLPGNHY